MVEGVAGAAKTKEWWLGGRAGALERGSKREEEEARGRSSCARLTYGSAMQSASSNDMGEVRRGAHARGRWLGLAPVAGEQVRSVDRGRRERGRWCLVVWFDCTWVRRPEEQ